MQRLINIMIALRVQSTGSLPSKRLELIRAARKARGRRPEKSCELLYQRGR